MYVLSVCQRAVCFPMTIYGRRKTDARGKRGSFILRRRNVEDNSRNFTFRENVPNTCAPVRRAQPSTSRSAP